MNHISNALFWISEGLLVPVIILLLLFFLRSLLLAGGFFGQFLSRRKSEAKIQNALENIPNIEQGEFKKLLQSKDNGLFSKYVKEIYENKDNTAYCERLLANFEIDADKDLAQSKTLIKLGPVLGLMGTLIPMGPALVGLSSGDIGSMAYNMQVAFATTVAGLVIGAIGTIIMQIKQRWYLQDLTNLEFVYKITNQTSQQ